ncbi:MAG: hypothetical protein WCL21_16870 [Mariniphaga sp.]
MKKLIYLFVMIAGMSLAVSNANAKDTKSTAKPETAACCKSGDKKCCSKDAAGKCQKGSDAKETSKDTKTTK